MYDTLHSANITYFVFYTDQRLSNDNVGFAVSVELNRSTTLYNVRLNWTLSVPDPVLYTINSLEVVRIIRLGSSIQDTDDAFAKVVVPNVSLSAIHVWSCNYVMIITDA